MPVQGASPTVSELASIEEVRRQAAGVARRIQHRVDEPGSEFPQAQLESELADVLARDYGVTREHVEREVLSRLPSPSDERRPALVGVAALHAVLRRNGIASSLRSLPVVSLPAEDG